MKKEKKSPKKDSLASAIEFPKEEKEDRTGLLTLKNDDMVAAITQTRKKKSTFKHKDIITEEEIDREKSDRERLEKEEQEAKETLEETVEEEVIEQLPSQSYNELEDQGPISYDSVSSSHETTYNAGQTNTSSKGITDAYEGSVPGSYQGTSAGGGAYLEGTAPDQGRSHNFYNPDNPDERVGEIRGREKSSLETTSQQTAREQRKNTFKPQRYQ